MHDRLKRTVALLLAGGVVAVGGVTMAMTGAVATGVWLASARGGDRG